MGILYFRALCSQLRTSKLNSPTARFGCRGCSRISLCEQESKLLKWGLNRGVYRGLLWRLLRGILGV